MKELGMEAGVVKAQGPAMFGGVAIGESVCPLLQEHTINAPLQYLGFSLGEY